MKSILVGILFCVTQITNGQNLVPNPSFEKVNEVVPSWAGTFSKFNRWIKGWNSPTQGSPDLLFVKNLGKMFPKRPKVDLTKHQPRTGKFMVGIKTFGCQTNTLHCKEYIQTKLKEPLVEGEKYYLEFWVAPIETSVKVNSFGLVLSNELVQDLSVIGPLDRYPVFSSDKIITTDSMQWQRISTTFEADDNYPYIILGNFSRDQAVDFKIEKEGLDYGYYLIDDVLLKPLFDKKPTEFTPNETIILNNLLFEYDKALILENSNVELDKLVLYLKSNPKYLIEIKGHTDAKGNSTYNLNLSQRRANEVEKYLVQHGIKDTKIKAIGVGAQYPIVDNDTEEHRQMNRRVEIKLTEE